MASEVPCYSSHYQWQQQTLRLQCYVQPNASRDELVGIYDPGPRQRLKIRIKAPALEGKANRHLLKFVARLFAVSKNQVTIIQGENSRAKTLQINRPQQLPSGSEIQSAP